MSECVGDSLQQEQCLELSSDQADQVHAEEGPFSGCGAVHQLLLSRLLQGEASVLS